MIWVVLWRLIEFYIEPIYNSDLNVWVKVLILFLIALLSVVVLFYLANNKLFNQEII